MIKVIIERRAKAGEDLSPILWELRVAAITNYRGYVSGETLVSTEDPSIIVVISTWQSLEDWERWAKSETRAKICQQLQPMLVEEPKVRTFYVKATERTVGF